MNRRISLLLATLLAAAPAVADFQISPTDGSSHSYPAVCTQPDGFVVAWETSGDEGSDVVVQRLDGDGRPIGTPERANQESSGDQQLPDIACHSDGSFLVVWESRGQDGDGLGIFARNFRADGTAASNEIQVNSYTTDNQRRPRVCARPGGGAVIVWDSFGQDGDGGGIYAQRLAPGADGGFNGDNFLVNSITTGSQVTPAIACSTDGSQVVAWADVDQNRIDTVYYDVTGTVIVPASISPSQVHPGPQVLRHPAVAPLDGTSFNIAYESSASVRISHVEITGPERAQIRTFFVPSTRRNEAPTVISDGAGGIVAAWSNGAGFDFSIEAVRMSNQIDYDVPTRVEIGTDPKTNNGALSTQGRGIALADAPNGDLVLWQKRDVFADDSTSSIFSQRFKDCIGDCSEDSLVRVNELILGVRIALGQSLLDECSRLDDNGSGSVEINELIRAVGEALASICPAPFN